MSESKAQPPRVLLVDDEEDLLYIYSEFLSNAGYSVSAAGDGRRAMSFISQGPFDVVLTDINMPDMDGIQLLRAVRERDLDVPVILLTGNPRVETAIQALELGALSYLIKPLKEDDLVSAARSAIRLHGIARLKREFAAHLGADEGQIGDKAGLESRFARALSSLWMAYQPIVRAADGVVTAREALVRTEEPTLGHPGALFDAAERLGSVRAIGRAVRDSVAAHIEGSTTDGNEFFVNLHAQDLADEALFSSASRLSKLSKRVVLEITERATFEGVPDVRGRVDSLRGMGYRIALDDLGAGYAGLNTFAAVKPDIAKLDMALVRDVDKDTVKLRIVGSMTALCKELGILVVAEGVETASERNTLIDLGCDLLQGFLFGRPSGRPAP